MSWKVIQLACQQFECVLQAKGWAERWSHWLDSMEAKEHIWEKKRWSISLPAVGNQAILVWGACHQIDRKLQAEWWAERWSNRLDSSLNVWCKPKGWAERLSHWLDSMDAKEHWVHLSYLTAHQLNVSTFQLTSWKASWIVNPCGWKQFDLSLKVSFQWISAAEE